MDDEFEIPGGEFRHESAPVKGSRFLASIGPATTVEEAEAFVAGRRADDPDASHHCWAYRIGRPADRYRFSDDGEPGGSAGRPILQQIEGHGLTDTVCVVMRWFGGTKLGVGGLMRAYGGCAGQALDLVPRRVVRITERVRVRCSYELEGALQALFVARGLKPVSSDYGEAVEHLLEIPRRDRAEVEREIRDRTSGQALID